MTRWRLQIKQPCYCGIAAVLLGKIGFSGAIAYL
jgi:hypothetical protein